MIQRIQTLYMIISLLMTFLISISKFSTLYIYYNNNNYSQSITAIKKYYFCKSNIENQLNITILIIFITILIITFICILSFNNTHLQLKICYLNIFLYLISLFLCIYDTIKIANKYFFILNYTFNIGMYLFILGIASNILSIKFIKSDQKILDSINRIR
ncbi:MAG: DUF4293 family protein [Bacteroides sp.]|nr:MAG: DUF4293 family protein [Bacteroides sp.]